MTYNIINSVPAAFSLSSFVLKVFFCPFKQFSIFVSVYIFSLFLCQCMHYINTDISHWQQLTSFLQFFRVKFTWRGQTREFAQLNRHCRKMAKIMQTQTSSNRPFAVSANPFRISLPPYPPSHRPIATIAANMNPCKVDRTEQKSQKRNDKLNGKLFVWEKKNRGTKTLTITNLKTFSHSQKHWSIRFIVSEINTRSCNKFNRYEIQKTAIALGEDTH